MGSDGTIKRIPLQSSNLLTSLDLASIHRSQVLRKSSPTYDAKINDQCSKLSEFPYSTVVGPGRCNDVESETRTFVESNKLDQCFTSGRVTVRNNISSFDETVHSYPSRFVPASEARPPPQHFDDPQLRTQPPSAPFSTFPTSSAPFACRERMCDAEVRHIDVRQPPSFTARERVSDAEVWNSTAHPRERTTTSYYGGAAVPTMPASDRRALAQAMAQGHYATRFSAAPAAAPRTCVLPLTVTALVSPRPTAARCYTYQPAARAVRKEHQYC